ncbi:hypothetical protein K443DRAFT_13904 [Laccaria amethystina LaAM-08-1]|uniref:Uncharacterized protein n=1 Tax=Laccaria amethystina LaAM-08-1 TaxID=1095629 RepID=A0A0C9WHZ6_9AGAR|nr:hypothetical protein K443DRAFT_13904 [Laccaria amethystina LaAM-08-1]
MSNPPSPKPSTRAAHPTAAFTVPTFPHTLSHWHIIENPSASLASDTSKRKLINQEAQPENQPASKKTKPALPSGLLNPPKTPAVKNPVAAHDPNFSSRYGGIFDSELADSALPAVVEKAQGKRQPVPSPPSLPQSPSTFPTSLLGSRVSSCMHIDQGEILCVRAEGDQLCDDEPGPQKIVEGIGAEHKGSVALHYNVIGLGPVAWWTGETEGVGNSDGEGDAIDEG